jgi:hypothetical protein
MPPPPQQPRPGADERHEAHPAPGPSPVIRLHRTPVPGPPRPPWIPVALGPRPHLQTEPPSTSKPCAQPPRLKANPPGGAELLSQIRRQRAPTVIRRRPGRCRRAQEAPKGGRQTRPSWRPERAICLRPMNVLAYVGEWPVTRSTSSVRTPMPDSVSTSCRMPVMTPGGSSTCRHTLLQARSGAWLRGWRAHGAARGPRRRRLTPGPRATHGGICPAAGDGLGSRRDRRPATATEDGARWQQRSGRRMSCTTSGTGDRCWPSYISAWRQAALSLSSCITRLQDGSCRTGLIATGPHGAAKVKLGRAAGNRPHGQPPAIGHLQPAAARWIPHRHRRRTAAWPSR